MSDLHPGPTGPTVLDHICGFHEPLASIFPHKAQIHCGRRPPDPPQSAPLGHAAVAALERRYPRMKNARTTHAGCDPRENPRPPAKGLGGSHRNECPPLKWQCGAVREVRRREITVYNLGFLQLWLFGPRPRELRCDAMRRSRLSPLWCGGTRTSNACPAPAFGHRPFSHEREIRPPRQARADRLPTGRSALPARHFFVTGLESGVARCECSIQPNCDSWGLRFQGRLRSFSRPAITHALDSQAGGLRPIVHSLTAPPGLEFLQFSSTRNNP